MGAICREGWHGADLQQPRIAHRPAGIRLLKNLATKAASHPGRRKEGGRQAGRKNHVPAQVFRENEKFAGTVNNRALQGVPKPGRAGLNFIGMRIKKLELKNFRGFEELVIDFPEGESGLAVFVGVNGSGKTSVLEGIVSDLYFMYESAYTVDPENGVGILGSNFKDIKLGSTFFENDIYLINEGEVFKIVRRVDSVNKSAGWTSKITSPFIRNVKDKIDWKEKFKQRFQENPALILYYPTNRTVNNSPSLASNDLRKIGQIDAFLGVFKGEAGFEEFFEWFRSMEDIENEQRLYADDSYRHIALEAVRRSISIFLNEISNPRVQRQPKEELIIEKNGQKLFFYNLSDGERMLVAMVGDIARRMSFLNPEDPLSSPGIILIDEIEQHLHPGLQRTIIPNLRRTFPNIQFILTTHSPQVLSTLKKENVFILDNFQLVQDTPHTYGRDSNSILWDIFGVEKRPPESKEIFSKLYRMMDDPDKVEETEALLRDVEERYGYYDEEVVRARGQFEFLNEK
ncbi:MAG: AAA family ATPase [Saprospiraceae bacterium]